MSAPLRMVVLADSTAFVNDRGPQLPSEPTLYPNVLAGLLSAELGQPVEATVLARAGMTVREAWKVVSKDRHAQFDVLAGADIVVVGLGGFDHAPLGVPEVVGTVVPYVRPAVLRSRLRKVIHQAYPWGARTVGLVLPRVPAKEFDRLYDLIMMQVRGLAQGAAGLALGPTSHNSSYYGNRHRNRAASEARQLDIAARHGFATLPVWSHVLPAIDRLNPDGIHWPADVHASIAAEAAPLLLAQLRGEVARLQPPTFG